MSARPVQYDAIDTIRCLGYSERQASFIYTVAVHSGYFLRRQFNVAVQRRRGWTRRTFSPKQNVLGTFEKSSARHPACWVSIRDKNSPGTLAIFRPKKSLI